MKKHRQVLKDEVSDVVCDLCGSSCLKSEGNLYSAEFAVIKASWGYWSRKDGSECSMDICEDCFDKIISFMGTISEGS